MIRVEFNKAPHVVTVMTLLDNADSLQHLWTLSVPYDLMVAAGNISIGGDTIAAPGFDEIPPGEQPVFIGLEDASIVISMMELSTLDELLANDAAALANVRGKPYAGTFRDRFLQDGTNSFSSVTHADLIALAGVA